MMRRSYKTREKCERAITRHFWNGRPESWDLEAAYNEKLRRWYPRIRFSLRTRARAACDALEAIREDVGKLTLDGDEPWFSEQLKEYVSGEIKDALTALGDLITTLKILGEREGDPSTPLSSAQDDTEESEDAK